MHYQEIKKISKREAESLFASQQINLVCEALIALAFYEQDWKWVQNKCLDYLENNNPEIRGVAATCLGHIARIHHKLEKKKVISALQKRLNDIQISGQVNDALDDIAIFLYK